jgi:DNA-binding XRE family transcriptional regulator
VQASPAIGRHQLGVHLRQLRISRSMRLEDAAAKLEIAPSTLSRIEKGLAPTRTSYLLMLLDLYGVQDPERRKQLTEMAAAGQRKDWWADHASLLPAGTGTYLGLEAAAGNVREFAAHAVPGLLQTPGYAQAFFQATRPELDPAQISSLVSLQHRRQQQGQAGRTLDLVLDESVLLRSIGSPRVMAGQLAHLLTLTANPSVTIRVIRLTATRPVLSPSFTLLSLPGTAGPGIACLEGIGGQIDITRRAADAETLDGIFQALVTSALTAARSAKLIGKHAERAQERQ